MVFDNLNLKQDYKRIMEFRDSVVYNVGHSEEVIIRQIDAILKGKI